MLDDVPEIAVHIKNELCIKIIQLMIDNYSGCGIIGIKELTRA